MSVSRTASPFDRKETMKKNKAQSELHDAATKLGHAGGIKGGPERAKRLSQEERSEIARKAAKARWKEAALHQDKPKQKRKPKETKPAKAMKTTKAKGDKPKGDGQ